MRKLTKKTLDDLATVMPVISEDEQRRYVGGTDSDFYYGYTGTVYSTNAYNALVASGAWSGGVVEGMGYIAQDIVIFSGSGTYYTMPEYIESQSMSGLKQFIFALIQTTPVLGDFISYYVQESGDMHRSIQAELLHKGYSDAMFYVQQETLWNGWAIKVYDSASGEVIASRTMTEYGSWGRGVY
jgi:hypothetical protein